METRQQIDRIIQHRHEKAKTLAEDRRDLNELLTSLKKLRGMEAKCAMIKDDKLRGDFHDKLRSLGLPVAIKQTEALTKALDEVINRFQRDYISIATIGKERQGKSRFLQSVSCLDDKVIPAYSGTSCTGATSVIRNDPSIPEGQLRAVITYKKRDDIVNLVRDYVRIIKPDYPVSEIEFDNVEYLPLNLLRESTGTDALRQTSFTHLESIVNNFFEFSDLFDSSPETLTDPDAIKRIVAQNNGKAITDPDSEQYYKYLAVARADIYCRFFYDPGKIRLIDTVGIESTQLGVAQAMLDTVKNESDAAIVVNRPIADPQNKDVEIYTDITKQFKDKSPEKWLFYLINHVKGQNDNTVAGFDRSISTWGIAGHMIVNCADPTDVNEHFMKPMLETLLRNIDDIDASYLKELGEKNEALQNTIRTLISAVSGMSTNDRSWQGTQALEKGKQCFNTMGAQLRKMVDHYSHERHEPNHVLWNETQKILNNLDGAIAPSAEVIQSVADKNNVVGGDVWNVSLHYVRNEITRRFTAIDDKLAKENIRFKNSLIKVLYMNLKEIFGEGGDANDDSIDMTHQLLEMMEKTIADNPKYAQIYEAIAFLDSFTFNTRATIIQAVRSQLCIINPLCEEYAAPSITFYSGRCGREIDYFLTSRLSLIEENLRHALMGIYNTPNEAFYAVAEEFYDRLTFAATDLSSGIITNMSDIWGYFFQEYAHLLWKDQAQDYEQINAMVSEAKALLPLLQKCGKQ